MLGTEATVAREYTHALVRSFGQGCDVTLVGSGGLAPLAEAVLAGGVASDAAIRAEIAPCFVQDGGERTDTVVLACTHYPLLLDRFEALAPWPVRWIDPAPAIARRVVELVGPSTGTNNTEPAPAFFTSGRAPSIDLAAALTRFGLKFERQHFRPDAPRIDCEILLILQQVKPSPHGAREVPRWRRMAELPAARLASNARTAAAFDRLPVCP